MIDFKTRLLQLLNERNIKQSELAHGTGIDKGAISSYLKGKYIPKQNNINSIANFFNVSSDYLMGFVDNPYDLNHQNDLSEIFWHRLSIAINNADISSLNNNDKELLNQYSSNPTKPNFDILKKFANLLNTNCAYLIGLTDNDNPDYFDPMDNPYIYTDEIIQDALIDPSAIYSMFSLNKEKENKDRLNNIYNTLYSLGIHRIKGSLIKEIDKNTLLVYYSIIMEHLRHTSEWTDYDTLINKKISNEEKLIIDDYTYENIKNITTSYIDFFSLLKVNSIDDVKNGIEFENYVIDILCKNGYSVNQPFEINSYDFIISIDDTHYYVDCKMVPDVKNLQNFITHYAREFGKRRHDIYEGFPYILITNIKVEPKKPVYHILKELYANVWDYDYFKKLEEELKMKNDNKYQLEGKEKTHGKKKYI